MVSTASVEATVLLVLEKATKLLCSPKHVSV